MLPDLLDQISEGEPITSVTADGAYDDRPCLDAIVEPTRSSRPAGTPSAGRRLAMARQAATRLCVPLGASAGRSRGSGVATTTAAASRPR